MQEIRLEKLMEVLELPMETFYRLSIIKSPQAQRMELANIKALVLTQKRKLIAKYTAQPGVTVIGAKNLDLIEEACKLIMTLEVPPTPQEMMKVKL